MKILKAFDLTKSHRDAAELTGCSHHTVGLPLVTLASRCQPEGSDPT